MTERRASMVRYDQLHGDDLPDRIYCGLTFRDLRAVDSQVMMETSVKFHTEIELETL